MVLVMVRAGEEIAFIAQSTCDTKVEELTAQLVEVPQPPSHPESRTSPSAPRIKPENFWRLSPVCVSVLVTAVQTWNGLERLKQLCAAAESALGASSVKDTDNAAAAHVCLADAKDLTTSGSNAVATTPGALDASATALCTAVESAFGGEKKVPSSSGWKDATAEPGSGSGDWMSDDAELWMASRAFEAGTQLSERIGRNEKTRITVRLQRPASSPEPVKKKKKMTKAEQKAAEKAAAEEAGKAAKAAEAAAAAAAAVDVVPPRPEEMAQAKVQSSMLRAYVEAAGVGAREARSRKRAVPDSERGDSDDEGGPRLKLAHFRMCENSEKARQLLRDERLQDVIRQIDAHASDKDREAALQERLANDQPFAEAVDELLVSMGMARRDGSTGEVQSEA